MRALLQRVRSASVSVDGRVCGRCGGGLLVFLGVARGDGVATAEALAEKCARYRIFEDEAGKMNRSVLDVAGSCLVISQFTLCADTQKGNRPSFNPAEEPTLAQPVFDAYVRRLAALGLPVETGEFGAEMMVSLENDGPVTILLEKEEIGK